MNDNKKIEVSRLDWDKFEEAAKDQRWRLTNLYYIKDRAGRKIRFVPNEAQWELYDQMWYKNIILKARQRGFTTMIQILALDNCLFTDNYTAGINAHNLEDAQSFFKDKVKFAYDHLPEWVKRVRPADTSSSKELAFSNGSRIRVSTSLRSGTYQFVHISEFGKICARQYEKAREIVTGTLNAVGTEQIVFIESTAEGKGGYFYEMCQKAQEIKRQKRKLTKLDYKFFFSPWWEDPEYQLDPVGIEIPQRLEKYFDQLEVEHGIVLTDKQKAWYVKKEEEQKEDMKREFPSTPDEAFEMAIKGAFYKDEMELADKQGRIARISHDPTYPVHTAWDLGGAGGGDFTAIWFFQVIGREIRLVDYWQGNGYSMAQIINLVIIQKQKEHGYMYGQHFAPHDIEVTDYSAYNPDTYEPLTRKQVAYSLGLGFTVVPRIPISDGINNCREIFPLCYFDQKNCEIGINCLREYQRVFDKQNGVFKPEALKNHAIHGADAFRYLSTAYKMFISPHALQEPKSVDEAELEMEVLGL